MYVAFFRNLNLGHTGSPNRAQLVEAFELAGAGQVRSFQTNGTVVFATDDPAHVLAVVAEGLRQVAGYDDVAIIVSVQQLSELMATDPFAGFADEQTYRETLTFHSATALPWRLPWTNARGDLDIVAAAPGVAFGITRKNGSTAGNPTAAIEADTGAKATTRTRGTIERLLAST